MSEETVFKMSDYIGQGHSMASVPPRVHRMAKEVFAIPQEFHFQILPSSMLPITKMQEFSVPLQNIPNGATQPSQYFSREAPDRIEAARRLPRILLLIRMVASRALPEMLRSLMLRLKTHPTTLGRGQRKKIWGYALPGGALGGALVE
jgi:hypothetical protein